MIIPIFLLFLKLTNHTPDITTSDQVAEKVYLHIDRAYYTTGDDIWFKAYVIDPATNRLSANTNNLHVELINPDNKIIQERTIRIENGTGNGDFRIDDYSASGKYIIRAYTNHLRNFGNQFFFRKQITIINPFTAEPGLSGDTISRGSKQRIAFFPEGGSLTENVLSRVAFRCRDEYGKGCDATGVIYSSSGDSITSFSSTHRGMGIFLMRPDPGKTYYAVIKSPSGSETRAFLPEAFPEGFTISGYITPEKLLFVTIRTNSKTYARVSGNNHNLIISSRNLVTRVAEINIPSPFCNIILPLEGFPDGILRVTLSDDKGKPLCERLMFLQKNDNIGVNLSTDKNEYKPREKVHVGISFSGDSASIDSGVFSLSAAETRYTDKKSGVPASIASWFLLESDIRGPIEEPSSYFDINNPDRFEELDLLLLTHGWRDFIWKYDSIPQFKHEIGFTVSGNVKRRIGTRPLNRTNVNLGVFGPYDSQIFNCLTDSSGYFSFDGLNLIGRNKLLLSANDRRNRVTGVLTIDSAVYEPADAKGETFSIPPAEVTFQEYTFLKDEVSFRISENKKYTLSDTLELGEVFITAERTVSPQESHVGLIRKPYGTPDKEIIITPAMQNSGDNILSFISGRISGIRVNGSRIFNIKSYPPVPALIYLDGVEINSDLIEFLMAQPVYMFERIDILDPTPLLGMRGAGGAVCLFTRVGSSRGLSELDPGLKAVFLRGYDEPRIFYSPDYTDPGKEVFRPDHRATIHWEPDIYLGSDSVTSVSYFNADKKATIEIVVEGITEGGIPLCAKTSYEVK